MTINFTAGPYWDDFVETNKFHKILFRPGYAVQARELTQIQSILQEQIKKNGDHIFKNGSMVIPGQLSIDTKISYVKLQPLQAGNSIASYVEFAKDKIITGSSGLTAKVIHIELADGSDPITLYVRYTNSGTDTITKTFTDNETITFVDDNTITRTITTALSAATGTGSLSTIEKGVYYVNGYYVLCDNQTIVLNKYNNTPSYRIGLKVVESIITPEEDSSLLDNAQGANNYAAPGAHRYHIDLQLSKLALTDTADEGFIELSRIVDGELLQVTTTSDYSQLEKTLARRTQDESGDYTVRAFNIDVREHRNNDRGPWAASTPYLVGDIVTYGGNSYVAIKPGTSAGIGVAIPPSHSIGSAFDGPGSTGVKWEYTTAPNYNRGVYTPEDGGNEAKLAIGLEPGKAYVQGYEIEKIATEFVEIDKSRTTVAVDNAIIPATVGWYIKVTNVNNIPDLSGFATVSLYDRITDGVRGVAPSGATKVGTARVRSIEWDNGTIGTQAAIYKLFLFDIQLNSGVDFNRDVKSVFMDRSGSAVLSFSADIEPVETQLIGSISGSTTTITGVGTSFQTDLSVGDYIKFIGTSGSAQLRRIVTITSQQSLTVDTAPSPNVTGVPFSLVTTQVYEPENLPLIFPLPYYAIGSVNATETSYTVSEQFSGTSNGSGVLSISTSSGSFASSAETDNYIVVDNVTGSVVSPTTISPSGNTCTISGGLANNRSYSVIAAVNKSGNLSTRKSKTIYEETVTFTTSTEVKNPVLNLGKADGYRIISVLMASTIGGTDYSVDISDRFEFDNGQRLTHYDNARLIFIKSFEVPTGSIKVTFEYFEHGSGDYFTVDSYESYLYSLIPSYSGYQLRDCIDFRPRINSAGTGFSGAGSSMSLLPKRGIDIRADYTYYLPRKDLISVDINGKFFQIPGVASLNPGRPQDSSMGMTLYDLTLEPYTFGTSPDNVIVEKIENKRYTMRDIGKLEKRIENVEYYTALSLLEQETSSLKIIDSDGLDRFKSGFIVDNFTSHNTGDSSSPDYLCSLDFDNGELRPQFEIESVNLLEKNTTALERSAANYKLYGDVITLPVIEDVKLVEQPYASRTEFINPYAIFTFLGNTKMTPSSDDWFEVSRMPNIVNQVMGNYNTIKAIADRSNILGTFWNSWQTTWSGVVSSTRAWTGWVHVRKRQMRNDLIRTDTIQTNQSRVGVKTSLVEKFDNQLVDDKVISTAVIPFMRQKNVLVQIKMLKPNTRFYVYCDDVALSHLAIPSSYITYTPNVGSVPFDDTTNAGGATASKARRIVYSSTNKNGETEENQCLSIGDVITSSSTDPELSGKTAVVVGKDFINGVYRLHVQAIRGPSGEFITSTFTNGDIITGSISGAVGTVVSAETNKYQGAALTTNANGELNFIMHIPNSDQIRFRTGTREIKLIDVSTPTGEYTSKAAAQFKSTGILQTKQATINSVRNAEIVTERLAESRTIYSTATTVEATQWYDPLAQTFLVQNKGGAFLSKVDIFFAKKDTTMPVTLEIREVVNGYPGKNILPFSKVTLKPEQVNISSNLVTFTEKDGTKTVYPKYDTATSFVFPSPVYVQDGTEYCIVLLSDSNNYKAWISQLGDQIPDSTRTISEQPYAGVLFKSQNASTWTADQTQDLKFTIWRAKFDTNVVSNVEFVNDALPFIPLANDPFEMKAGTNIVRVWHKNHGMPAGSTVSILPNGDETILSGISGTGTISVTSGTNSVSGSGTDFGVSVKVGDVLYTSAGIYIGVVNNIGSTSSLTLVNNSPVTVTGGAFKYAASLNGIPVTDLFKQNVISNVDLDCYTITASRNATVTGYAGAENVRASKNVQFDVARANITYQNFPDTQCNWVSKQTSGKSVDGAQTPYVLESSPTPFIVNDNNEYMVPHLVASEVNETINVSGNKTFHLSAQMQSDNDSLSPVIDTHRTSLILINNRVNNPTESNINVSQLDTNQLFTGTTGAFNFSGSTITSTNATIRTLMLNITVGSYIQVDGATTSGNNGAYLVTNVYDNGSNCTVTISGITFTSEAANASTAISVRKMFFSEITPVGSSSVAKYVSKIVTLAEPATFFKIRYAGNIPETSDVEVYYKSALGSSVDFNTLNWTLINPEKTIVKSQVGSDEYKDIDYSIEGLAQFDNLSIKIVMKSTNSAAVPKLRDLRIIACA